MSGTPWTLLLFVAEVALIHTSHTSALAQTASAAPASKVASAAAGRVFASDAGLVLNFIKADKASDFETVMARLKEALVKSEKPERKQQAAGWKVFRAIEPGANGSVLYLFTIDPAIKGADYTVANILAEAFPSEVQELYKKYSEAYASGQNIVSLNVLMSFGQSVTPVQ
jgi:hypothetical protein